MEPRFEVVDLGVFDSIHFIVRERETLKEVWSGSNWNSHQTAARICKMLNALHHSYGVLFDVNEKVYN